MRGFRVYGIVLLVSLLVSSLCGCTKEEDVSRRQRQNAAASGEEETRPKSQSAAASSDEVPSEANSQGVRVGDVLASWESGKQEDAVKQLLSIRWDEPTIFDDVPQLNLSEDEYRALSLSHDERTRKQKEYRELVSTFKNLSRHCFSVGEDAQASGDEQTAKAHYEAVLHLGQTLFSPKRVSIMQGTGKALVRMAEEKLSALK